MFDPMINEANGSSSACRLWRVPQVETSTPPDSTENMDEKSAEVKSDNT
jgi:hypothetical protein